MRIAWAFLPLLGLAACGDAAPRVTDAGPCLVVVERQVCTPAGVTPICTREAFLAVRRTPECLPGGTERGA